MSQQPAAMNTIALSENGAAALADAVRIATRKTTDDVHKMLTRQGAARVKAAGVRANGWIEEAAHYDAEARGHQYRIERANNLLCRLEGLADTLQALAAAGDPFAPLDD